MALVGKILTFMILIMSLLFMGFAVMNYAAQRNWKALVQGADGRPGLNAQLTDVRNQVREGEQQLAELRNRIALETAARRSALAVLEVQSRDTQLLLETEQQRYEELQRDLDRNIATLKTAQDDMKRLKDQTEALRSDGKTLLVDRTAQLQSVTELTDKINQGEGPLRRLAERSQQLRGE